MQQDVRAQRLFVIITLTLLFISSAGVGVFMLWWNPKPLGPLREVQGISTRVTRATAAPIVVNAPAGWREKFDAVYTLADGQFVKRIPPPWIPEREYYYRVENAAQAQAMPEMPSYMMMRVQNGRLLNSGMGWMGNNNFRRAPSSVIQSVAGVRTYQMEVPAALAALDVGGDYLLREPSTPQQKLDGLAKIFGEVARKQLRFVQKELERDVVVVRGSYQFKPKLDAPDPTVINLYSDAFDPPQRNSGGGTVPLPSLMESVSSLLDTPIIVDGDLGSPGPVKFKVHQSLYRARAQGPSSLDKVLANLSDQTGLKFERTKRPSPVWVLEEQ
jgi:hypothetical protein